MASLLGVIGALGAGVLALFGQQPIDTQDYAARTKHVLQSTPLIDGHNDLPYLLRLELKNKIYQPAFSFEDGKHFDLRRWKIYKLMK